MDNKLSTKKWVSFLEDRGISREVIDQYIPYIKKLIQNNVPVIFENEHLSNLLGIKRLELNKMINSPKDFYREFSIPKRRGGKRIIFSPYASLLSCQVWIYKNILLKSEIHEKAHGFVPNKSIITNATSHLNKKALLKMDVSNFFPSIPFNWVINYFSQLGYAKNISFYLASLCCLDGSLPQGAASSPYLSNVLLFKLDERLYKLSNLYGLAYTRYADDLTFSGNYIPLSYINLISEIVRDYGLLINKDKTKLHTKRGQRIVTGISVVGTELSLPRETKRQLRQDIYFIRKYGFLSHASKIKINYPNYLDSIEGKFRFWLQIEPHSQFAHESVKYLVKLKNS